MNPPLLSRLADDADLQGLQLTSLTHVKCRFMYDNYVSMNPPLLSPFVDYADLEGLVLTHPVGIMIRQTIAT